jgi:hypothetical protein
VGWSLAQGEQQGGLDEPLDPGRDLPLVRSDESSIPGPRSAASTSVVGVWSWRHVSNIYVNNIYVKYQYAAKTVGIEGRLGIGEMRLDVDDSVAGFLRKYPDAGPTG